MSLALLPLRSTGAERSCDPALIDTVITNSPLCPGDHINLSVVASGDILGYSWQGPGTGEYFTFTPEFSFSFQILGAYVVVVYGECGNDTATVMINAAGAGAGHDDTLHLCDDGPPRDLAVELGTHAVGGSGPSMSFRTAGSMTRPWMFPETMCTPRPSPPPAPEHPKPLLSPLM
ncbi:MAG: hypothetical protein IPL81_00010 [Flavobacteriales bacterium]|nr:hypothetical protein [Flavobacteriales bacterium]